MVKYFHVSRGLRGCYMPDDSHVARVDTRRELKEVIESEAENVRSWEGTTLGLSQKTIASFAALCWREAQKKNPAFLPYALPYKERSESDYHNAIFISVASRDDYKEYCKENPL